MTPICDLIADLTSRGLSLGDAIDVARKVEASGARSSGSSGEQRERWRIKAQEKRDRLKETTQKTKAEGITSNNQLGLSDSVKKESRVSETSRETTDDWPEDFLDRFWKSFPPYRLQAKAKVSAKLARIRAQTGKQKVTWAVLMGGVQKFAATNPGEFAPAPMVWLNDGRWDREYGSQQGGSNGASQGTNGAKVGFAGISARLRAAAAAEQDLPFERPSDGPRPGDRY